MSKYANEQAQLRTPECACWSWIILDQAVPLALKAAAEGDTSHQFYPEHAPTVVLALLTDGPDWVLKLREQRLRWFRFNFDRDKRSGRDFGLGNMPQYVKDAVMATVVPEDWDFDAYWQSRVQAALSNG
jgi:hypothetical protein